MGTAADLQSGWARLAVRCLVLSGVRHAVISPGSRSTPFTVAALEEPLLRCVSALDERAGAHFALGQARVTGVPSLLICTSGSAPANYFPAVVEAGEAGLPLIVLSADRPPELLHCGASQTTDQIDLYGRHARFFAQLGEPRADAESLVALRRTVLRAALDSRGPRPGPVHLNAQARKPLEPHPGGAAATELRERVDRICETPVEAYAAAEVDPNAVQAVASVLDGAKRPLVLCGPMHPWEAPALGELQALCARASLLLASEAAGQARFGEGGSAVLGAFDTLWRTTAGREDLAPDAVLQLGAHPVSKGWEELCASARIVRIAAHPWAWIDPDSSTNMVIRAPLPGLVQALSAALRPGRRDGRYFEAMRAAEDAAWRAADTLLDAAGDQLTEGGVARAVRDCAPEHSALVLGNSLPIRNFDTWAPPSESAIRVFSQRGVSGIDGVVSGAAGVASTGASSHTTLLVGDVSFLHDTNGLQLASQSSSPIVIVVVNNRGGRIFEQLPIARDGDPAWLPFFTTPHDASLAGAASIYGCAFERAASVSRLRTALSAAHGRVGCTVIEAVVPRRGSAEQNTALRVEVERTLRREGA